MSSEQHIIDIANQLAAEGKQPSVALIKARLSAPVAMPVLLAVLGRWKAAPEQFPSSTASEDSPQSPVDGPNEVCLTGIQQQLEQMQNQLDQMQQLLEQLSDNRG